jgi:hypothetical protein
MLNICTNNIFVVSLQSKKIKAPVQEGKVCEMIMELNGYHILWTIEVLENGKVEKNHWANKAHLDKKFIPKSGSKVYIINDIQFGMTQNTWNGTIPEVPKPFTRSLLIEDGKFKSLIPITKKQFESAIQY